MSDSGYSRAFAYDPVGNMWVTQSSGVPLAGNTPTANVYNANNQISGLACNQAGTLYDCAGNQLSVNGDTMAYDAENRQVAATEPPSLGGATEYYLYDGAGQRVEKTGPGGTTVFVYDAQGQLAAEYSTAAGTAPCTTCYLTWDDLGSIRMVTDQNGTVVARHDYLPFGEEIPANTAGRGAQWGSTTDVERKFTGKERDQETGLDYFGARYYGAALGRWTSPDWSAKPEPVPYADFEDPQTLNGYAYVRNNPLSKADADGHCADAISCSAEAGGAVGTFIEPGGGTVVGAVIGAAVGAIITVAVIHHVTQANSNNSQESSAQSAPKDVYIDPNKYPAAAGHAADAQAAGKPDVLTVDRPGADDRRRQATGGHPTQAGTDRDEYPPAVTAEGGKDASVKGISSSDNRGAGASVGSQIRDVPDGGKIRIIPKPQDQPQ